MPLELLELSAQVRQMGELLAQRRTDAGRRMRLLDALLADWRDRWEELGELAETVHERVAQQLIHRWKLARRDSGHACGILSVGVSRRTHA